MKNTYMTDEEYSNCFINFFGIREKISKHLKNYKLKPTSKVLDVLAGHGLFSLEMMKLIGNGEVHAVGLQNDKTSFNRMLYTSNSSERKLLERIKYHIMDTRDLKFPSEYFDFVVNFLGLEDLNMTTGNKGVKQSLREFVRVLKKDGIILITLWLEGDDKDKILAKEINEFIGHNATFYPKSFYIDQLRKFGVTICEEKWYYTGKKMTSEQAKEELSYSCSKTSEVFKEYEVTTVSFEDLWKKFGKSIERYGVAYYSELCTIIGKKHLVFR
jgi:ubiquinone/menaquinone biosynthesis C-methylase UbiE